MKELWSSLWGQSKEQKESEFSTAIVANDIAKVNEFLAKNEGYSDCQKDVILDYNPLDKSAIMLRNIDERTTSDIPDNRCCYKVEQPTTLMLATALGHHDIMQALLNAKPSGLSILPKSTVRNMLEQGPQYNYKLRALHFAFANLDIEAIKILLDKGDEVHEEESRAYTVFEATFLGYKTAFAQRKPSDVGPSEEETKQLKKLQDFFNDPYIKGLNDLSNLFNNEYKCKDYAKLIIDSIQLYNSHELTELLVSDNVSAKAKNITLIYAMKELSERMKNMAFHHIKTNAPATVNSFDFFDKINKGKYKDLFQKVLSATIDKMNSEKEKSVGIRKRIQRDYNVNEIAPQMCCLLSVMEVLLNNGAEISALDNKGKDIFTIAKEHGISEILAQFVNEKNERLRLAVISGDEAAIIELLKEREDAEDKSKCADVNAVYKINGDSDTTSTPLILAINNTKNPNIVKLLIDNGAKVNQQDTDYCTALASAFEKFYNLKFDLEKQERNQDTKGKSITIQKDIDAIKQIIAILMRNGASIDLKNNVNQTIRESVKIRSGGVPEVIELLNNPNPEYLKYAIITGNIEEVQKLLEEREAAGDKNAFLDLEKLSYQEEDPNSNRNLTLTPLMLATYHGQIEIMEALIKAGANVNTLNKDHEYSALWVAYLRNDPHAMNLLLENNSKIVQQTYNSTIIHEIISLGDVNTKEWETKAGVRIPEVYKPISPQLYFLLNNEHVKKKKNLKNILNGDYNTIGDNILYHAAFNNSGVRETAYGNVKILLENGASPNYCSILDRTTRELNIKLVELLLEYGADVNLTVKGDTPLISIVDILKKNNDSLKDPIFGLARTETKERISIAKQILTLLLKHGADPAITNQEGKTTLLLAQEAGLLEVAEEIAHPNNYYLKQAIINGDYNKVMELLLERSLAEGDQSKCADPNAVYENYDNNEELSSNFVPLMLALNHGELEIMELLISHGAKFNTSIDNKEYNALHIVIKILSDYNRRLENSNDPKRRAELQKDIEIGKRILKLLLKYPEDHAINDQEVKIALSFAQEENLLDVAEEIAHPNNYYLKQAIINGDSDKVGDLLLERKMTAEDQSKCADPNAVYQNYEKDNAFEQTFTPLMLAICHNQLDIVIFLIKEGGADINQQNAEGNTALIYASKKLSEINTKLKEVKEDTQRAALEKECADIKQIITFLIENGADVNLKNLNEKTALSYAYGATIELISPKNAQLRDAIIKGELDKVQALLDEPKDAQDKNVGVNLELEHREHINLAFIDIKLTPLMLATCHGQIEIMKALIEAGANVNACTSDRSSALYFACVRNDQKAMELLLEKGVDISLPTFDGNIFHTAIKWDPNSPNKYTNAKRNEITLKNEADPTIFPQLNFLLNNKHVTADKEKLTKILNAITGRVDFRKETLLTIITSDSDYNKHNNLIPIIQILIDSGADINQGMEYGFTPLMNAATHGSYECVEFLLNNMAEANLLSQNNHTALMRAIRWRYNDYINDEVLKIVELLLPKTQNIDQQDSHEGNTALIYAAQHLNELKAKGEDTTIIEEVIALLINKGANPELKNNADESYNSIMSEIKANEEAAAKLSKIGVGKVAVEEKTAPTLVDNITTAKSARNTKSPQKLGGSGNGDKTLIQEVSNIRKNTPKAGVVNKSPKHVKDTSNESTHIDSATPTVDALKPEPIGNEERPIVSEQVANSHKHKKTVSFGKYILAGTAMYGVQRIFEKQMLAVAARLIKPLFSSQEKQLTPFNYYNINQAKLNNNKTYTKAITDLYTSIKKYMESHSMLTYCAKTVILIALIPLSIRCIESVSKEEHKKYPQVAAKIYAAYTAFYLIDALITKKGYGAVITCVASLLVNVHFNANEEVTQLTTHTN